MNSEPLQGMDVKLANPRGFCAGVDRAIDIVERALAAFGPPVYVRHEVVHNRTVVEDLRQRGARFVDELEEVPDDSVVIFSAHGVPRWVQEAAAARQLKVFDATCPLVTKVHMEVMKFSRQGRECILIGHEGTVARAARCTLWRMKRTLLLWRSAIPRPSPLSPKPPCP